MRGRRAAGLVLAAALAGTALPGPSMAFSDRRLVVAVGEPGSVELERLGRLAESLRCRLADRDVDLIVVDAAELERLRAGPASAVPAHLAPAVRLSGPAKGFELLLVGKDGGVKARADDPDALEGFLGRIDAMPMRRAEVRRAGGADLGC